MANAASEEPSMPEFSLVIVGDKGVGKAALAGRASSSFYALIDDSLDQSLAKKLCAGKETNAAIKRDIMSYLPDKIFPIAQAPQFHSVVFETNKGPIRFGIRVFPTNRPLGCFCSKAHCAIIMFDVTSRITYKNAPNWYREVARITENNPVVLVGNKVDSMDRKVKTEQVTFHRKKSLGYCEVSSMDNSFIKPFIYLARRLSGDNSLRFTDYPIEEESILAQQVDVSDNGSHVQDNEVMANRAPVAPVQRAGPVGGVQERLRMALLGMLARDISDHDVNEVRRILEEAGLL